MEKEMAEIRHIYIAAESLLSALGDADETVSAIEAGISGLRYSPQYEVTAGLIDPLHRMAQEVEGCTRFESLLVRQIGQVCGKSGISLSDPSTGLVISTTKGNVDVLADKGLADEAFLYSSASRIASLLKAVNSPVVVSNACISGVSAFAVARNLIQDGRYDNVIVAGCDVLSEFIVQGFLSFKSISSLPCRPYDEERDGLTLGEACAAVALTVDKSKAGSPCVELCGAAVTNDANHISGPSRTGDGLFYAMDSAMSQARVSSSEVSFVNTHGTATRYNDEMESKAVALASMSETPLNAVKGYIGHTLGASGVVETVLCIRELRGNVLYASKGFSKPGTPMPVAISAQELTGREMDCCVKTASGFGGCNAAIVLRKGESFSPVQFVRERPFRQSAEYVLPHSEEPFAEFIRKEFKALGVSDMKFYKMSDLCKAVYVAVENLLSGESSFNETDPLRRAIVLANKSSSLEADMQHQTIVNQHNPEGASPAVFVYTLPNVAAGEMCIRHKIKGENVFFIEDAQSALAEEYAGYLIASGQADTVICGWCEKLGENWDVKLKLLEY